MKTIFLTAPFNEGSTTYFAIDESKIETLNVSDTYDRFGQKVSSCDAGDYASILKDIPVSFTNSEGETIEFAEGQVISAYEYPDEYDWILEKFGEDGDGYVEFEKDTVKGLTYWDGHNWKTVTVKVNFDEPSYLILEDETLITELNKAIEEKEFVSEGFGVKTYKGNGFIVSCNYFQGAWAEYEIVSEDEYENLKGVFL